MKSFFTGIILLVTTTCMAAPPVIPNGTTRATRNYSGGYTYYNNGRYNGHSRNNINGGQNTYDKSGRLSNRTVDTGRGNFRVDNYGRK